MSTTLAAPEETGMIFSVAPQLSRHSFPEEPSAVFWVAVMARAVLMSPSTMPKLSWMTLIRAGGKQLAVQEAVVTILRKLSYLKFVHITKLGAFTKGTEMK